MAEPARKLEPRDEDQYLRKIGEDIKKSQVDTTPDLHYLGPENGAQVEDGEYIPPDLEILGEDEDTEEIDQQEEDQSNLSPDDVKNALEKAKKYNQTPEEQLSENKVPDFTEKKIERPPGGKAIEPKTTGGAKPAGAIESGAKTAGKEAGAVAKKGAQAAADAAGQAVKQAAAKAAQWAAQLATKAIAATAEYWFPVLMIIIAVVIIVFAIIMLIRAWQTPNANGASPVVAADILGDRPWISKILALANDPNVASKLEGALTDLEAGLLTLETDMTKPPLNSLDAATQTKITAKIAEIRQGIATFRALQPTDVTRINAAKAIVVSVSQLVDLFAPAPCHYNGPTDYPIDPTLVTQWYSGTNDFHTGSYVRPIELSSGHGLFINNKKGIGDAVDIQAAPGTIVRAIFSGEYKESNDVNGRAMWIEGKDNSGQKFVAVYAHLRANSIPFGIGHEYKVGDTLGKLNRIGHVHLEVYCNGRPVVTTKAEATDIRSGTGKYGSYYGKYLYVRILNVFNLTPPF